MHDLINSEILNTTTFWKNKQSKSWIKVQLSDHELLIAKAEIWIAF